MMNKCEANSVIEREVSNALSVLRKGGIILYPTDTVWGIGCDATDADAVARIYALKRREDSKSMLALLDDKKSLQRWLDTVPQAALRLIDEAETPLTVIYDSPRGVAPNLIATDGSMGIRISGEEFTRRLCKELGKPLVSTSANISGRPTAPLFSDIEPEIIGGVDYVVDYRRDDTTPRSPSRIVKVGNDDSVTIIR